MDYVYRIERWTPRRVRLAGDISCGLRGDVSTRSQGVVAHEHAQDMVETGGVVVSSDRANDPVEAVRGDVCIGDFIIPDTVFQHAQHVVLTHLGADPLKGRPCGTHLLSELHFNNLEYYNNLPSDFYNI